MNNEITLHVGYIGKTKDGERVEIIEKISTINPYYRGDNNCAYWPNGRKSKILVSPDDIIGPWEEPKPAKNYNDGLWHGWNGSSECPAHPKTLIVCKADDGHLYSDGAAAWLFHNYTVIAFKVIKEYKEPREYWLDVRNGKIYISEIHDDLIHVREVA